ncbi:MAG: hypothetical protein E6J43_11610 [Chloroflexi bacterium]|nr:MAG: hypothetical protein E6J43_11610 [Chloroflexota bacterium]
MPVYAPVRRRSRDRGLAAYAADFISSDRDADAYYATGVDVWSAFTRTRDDNAHAFASRVTALYSASRLSEGARYGA